MTVTEIDELPPPTREERLSFLLGVFGGAAAAGFVMLLAVGDHHPRVALVVGWMLWIGCFLGAALTSVVLLNGIGGSKSHD